MNQKVPRRRVASKKPTERAMLFEVVRLVVPETGESIKAMVPAYGLDRRYMNDKGLRLGDLALVDVFKDRNPRFWRLWHALATFVADNVDALNGMQAHDALKHVQKEAGIYCEMEPVIDDATGKPTGYSIRRAKSLNFAETDETVATEVWEQLCDYIAKTYFGDWSARQVAEAAKYWASKQ